MKTTPDVARLRNLLNYEPSTGIFTWRISPNGRVPAGSVAGTVTLGYLRIKVDGVAIMAHRIAWLMVNEQMPAGQLDHINGDKQDNRIANLRCVTPRLNSENQRVGKRRKNGGSLLGASWVAPNKKWRASICHDGKTKHLGMFCTESDAHAAYVAAKRQLHEGGTL